MTVYVDDPMMFVKGKFKGYCHMWTDGPHSELNVFALGLGLKLEWAQHKKGSIIEDFYHFDVSPALRIRAIEKGASYARLSDYIKGKVKTQP